MRAVNITFFLSVLLLALLSPASVRAEGDEAFALSAESFKDGKAVELDNLPWRYHAGDSLAWAAKDYDDSNWQSITSEEIDSNSSSLKDWHGRAWFRLRVRTDEQLVGQPLALRVWHWGASEIYIDGKLIQRFGVIAPETDEEFNPRGLFVPVLFAEADTHTIAVRYSFKAASDLTQERGGWLARGGFTPGFRLVLASSENAALKLEARARAERLDFVFIGLFFALALVHFLLFIFYRHAPGNLFYSFFATGLALTILLARLANTGHFGATTALLTDVARENVQSLAVLALLTFLYVEFAGHVSRFFWVLLAVWLVGIILNTAQLLPAVNFTPVMILVTLADCLRIMARSLMNRRTGAWIVAVGIGVLGVGVGINIGVGHKFIQLPEWLHELNLTLTILSVPLAVSIYLARNFARTNRHLAAQLTQVQELSAQQLEHERTEAELRLQHAKEKAENERRAQELEEARQLQLSMLPKRLPELTHIEVAAYMKPATEVGGDYYDFHLAEDGTLTVVVGDATGHGLKAGTVVTAMKSLFEMLAPEEDILHIFAESNRVLRGMKLRGLFMALLMLKVRGHRLIVSTAGMPPALIHRAASGEIEAADFRGTPLGSLKHFAYRQQEFTLSAGDTIVLMSDGFPERFNEQGELLGYGKAATLLVEVAHRDARSIVDHFVRVGDEWAGGRPQEDDVTFVVLKLKDEG